MRKHNFLGKHETGERIVLTTQKQRNTPDRLTRLKYTHKLRKRVVYSEVK